MNLLSIILFALSVNCYYLNTTSPFALSVLSTSKCSGADEVSRSISYFWWKGDRTKVNQEGVLAGIAAFKRWLKLTPKEESFKYREGDYVGYMWVGSLIQNEGFANNVLTRWEEEIKTNGFPSSGYLEYFTGDAHKTFGVAFQTTGKLSSVQRAVRAWSSNNKFNTFTDSKKLENVPVCYLKYANRKPVINDERAGDCDKLRVNAEADFETQSGVDAESLQGYNPDLDFESMLIDDYYCKSIGKLN